MNVIILRYDAATVLKILNYNNGELFSCLHGNLQIRTAAGEQSPGHQKGPAEAEELARGQLIRYPISPVYLDATQSPDPGIVRLTQSYRDLDDKVKYEGKSVLINHFENNSVITTKSGLLRSLRHFYTHSENIYHNGVHVFESVPTTFM